MVNRPLASTVAPISRASGAVVFIGKSGRRFKADVERGCFRATVNGVQSRKRGHGVQG